MSDIRLRMPSEDSQVKAHLLRLLMTFENVALSESSIHPTAPEAHRNNSFTHQLTANPFRAFPITLRPSRQQDLAAIKKPPEKAAGTCWRAQQDSNLQPSD